MDYNIKLIITFFLSLILSFLFIKIYLRKKRIVNNKLREELIHNKNKASTPVGGFLFIASTFISLLIIDYKIFFDERVFPLIFLALIYFILGFIDDYKKRKSYKGLSAMIRMLVEVISAFIFLKFIDINEYINNQNKQYIEIEVYPELNGIERVFIELSNYKREAEYDKERNCSIMKIYYEPGDEGDLIIKMLSF